MESLNAAVIIKVAQQEKNIFRRVFANCAVFMYAQSAR